MQPLAISHYMKGMGCFPPRMRDPTDIAQLYFQSCAIEMNVQQLAVVASTLAAAGTCPMTQKKILWPSTVRMVLSHLYSCGMGTVRLGAALLRVMCWCVAVMDCGRVSVQHAGYWNFHIGIPAKAGSSGALMVRARAHHGCTRSSRLHVLARVVSRVVGWRVRG